jgi:hypothetical protein
MRMKRTGWALAIIFLMLGSAAVQAKQVIGWVERVRVTPGDIVMNAKIDTGAKTSSLNARDIKEFSRNGEQWVRFTVTNREGGTVSIERRLRRVAVIKRHFGGKERRLVVRLGICVAGVYRYAEVNLVDRSGFNYGLLIGRSFLKGRLVVDPGRTFTVEPECGTSRGDE